MVTRRVARAAVIAILAVASSLGRATAAERAQIRVSDENTIPQMRTLRSGDRYELRNATLVDLIGTAWGISSDNVVGGPEWLDTNRFDVGMQTPVGSSPEQLKAMLQAVLRARFGLVTHSRTEQVPAYPHRRQPNPAAGGEYIGSVRV
jgi:uncharacterized protein (TIGR03435 family)